MKFTKTEQKILDEFAKVTASRGHRAQLAIGTTEQRRINAVRSLMCKKLDV